MRKVDIYWIYCELVLIILRNTEIDKECVAVSIDICPLFNRVQFGIQVYLLSSHTPWCMLSINCVQPCGKTGSFTGPHVVQECIGILYFPTWCAKFYIGPGPGTAFFSRIIFNIIKTS